LEKLEARNVSSALRYRSVDPRPENTPATAEAEAGRLAAEETTAATQLENLRKGCRGRISLKAFSPQKTQSRASKYRGQAQAKKLKEIESLEAQRTLLEATAVSMRSWNGLLSELESLRALVEKTTSSGPKETEPQFKLKLWQG